MLEIELNKNEYDYINQADFLPRRLQRFLAPVERCSDKYLLKVPQDQAEEIRDLCGEQLQLIGFNEKYELTQEGKILESLIDKFFTG